jgi:hypothetical protein
MTTGILKGTPRFVITVLFFSAITSAGMLLVGKYGFYQFAIKYAYMPFVIGVGIIIVILGMLYTGILLSGIISGIGVIFWVLSWPLRVLFRRTGL